MESYVAEKPTDMQTGIYAICKLAPNQ
jgi:hypothetical protein